MTTREYFRSMRREFVLEGGDDETLREFVDQLTAPTYDQVATRPTWPSRGGRRVTTWRDLAMDVVYLTSIAAKTPAGRDLVFPSGFLAIERLWSTPDGRVVAVTHGYDWRDVARLSGVGA